MSDGAVRTEAAAAGLAQTEVPSARVRAASELLPRRPYPGLRPFEKAEWPIFRGRDRLVQDILTVLAENHFASIIGPSGSGKSSLVRAGVLATLERRHSRMGVRWRTGIMRPGVSPLWSMADGILRALRPEIVASDGEVPAAEVARLRVLIDASEDGLAALSREFELREHENFLLLVDQFEEIFRYRSDEEDQERARLVELLVAVAGARPPGLYIVTTMRSEYLGYCARFTGLAETLNETHYLLPRMTEAELRQAIVEPAELKGGRIEDALTDRLIADIRAQEDQLPILQHTLLWMWIQEEERQEREAKGAEVGIRLGLAEYEQLEAGRTPGREEVKNALSRHGDKILARMSPEERRVAEVMFRRLVEVEEHSSRLRRPTRCGTIARLADVSLEVVQRVVDAFRADDASFIYASRQGIADDTSIDIMHESLIRQWDTLDRWVRREKASCEVYSDLCRAARRMQDGQGSLLTGLALSRAQHWRREEQPTPLWARRYGGDFDAAIRFLTASEDAEEQRQREGKAAEEAARRQEEERERLAHEIEQQALRARLEEQTKLARERRRFTRFASAAAVVGFVLAAAAAGGFRYWYVEAERARAATARAEQERARADEAVVETKAGSFWYRLQLFGDPLRPEDVATLWDLSQQDERIRVAFVRQLAGDRGLLRRFGFKPRPIARAVGLGWPDEAREIVKQSLGHVASDQFDPSTADLFELITYTRSLAALREWLDPAVADTAAQKLASGINGLTLAEELTDRQLWTIAETVEVFGARLDPAAIAPARDRLRQEIAAAGAGDDADRRARALSRAIEVMAPTLSPDERLQAGRTLAPLLGQDIDSWSAKASPRALLALVPALDARQAEPIVNALPSAIARAALAQSGGDSSYLLVLMRLAEALGDARDAALATAFIQALAAQVALPNDPLQRAALASAAVPFLAQQGGQTSTLVPAVAAVTLVPADPSGDLDPAALQEAAATLRETLAAPAGEARTREAEAALQMVRQTWRADTAADLRTTYRRAAQARLVALLAPALGPGPAAAASAELLAMLPRTQDYLARDAIARALAALAPTLADPDRAAALAAAKIALAKTGSSEEATAWAGAIVALLPQEPRAATAEIVEALKYPTAAEAPSEVLLAALSTRWPDEHKAIDGRSLPDPTVLDWLEAHLPESYDLAAPPLPPPGLHAGQASLGPS